MPAPAPDSLPPMPPALLAEVQRDCDALARRRRRRWLAFAALALAGITALGVMSRAKHGALPGAGCGSPTHAALVAGFAVAGLGLIALAFGLKLPSGRALRPLPALGVALGLAGLATMAVLFGTAPMGHDVKCLTFGGVVAAALVGLAVAVGRPVMRRHAPSAGLFGVGVGLLALIPLSLACHDASMAHLMLWHGGVPVVGGLVGMGVWWLARPR